MNNKISTQDYPINQIRCVIHCSVPILLSRSLSTVKLSKYIRHSQCYIRLFEQTRAPITKFKHVPAIKCAVNKDNGLVSLIYPFRSIHMEHSAPCIPYSSEPTHSRPLINGHSASDKVSLLRLERSQGVTGVTLIKLNGFLFGKKDTHKYNK